MNLRQLKDYINSIPDTYDDVEVYSGSTDSWTTDSGTGMSDNKFEILDQFSISWQIASFHKQHNLIGTYYYEKKHNIESRQFLCIGLFGAEINKPYSEVDFPFQLKV